MQQLVLHLLLDIQLKVCVKLKVCIIFFLLQYAWTMFLYWNYLLFDFLKNYGCIYLKIASY
jgi:hypothetical protein